MTKKEAEMIGRRLLKYFPLDYTCAGPMVFRTPIGSVLCGLFIDGSGWDKRAFYPWVFAMPMYIEAQSPNFNVGERFDGPWSVDAGNWEEQVAAVITREVLPLLSRVETPIDLVKMVTTLSVEGRAARTVAYSYARSGDSDRAIALLERQLSRYDRAIPWQSVAYAADAELLAALSTNPVSAQAMLQRNEEKTILNLKLQKYYKTSALQPG